MIGGIGVWELVIILVILLLLFGPSRLGDFGSAMGKGIKGFKRSMKEPDEIDVTPPKEEQGAIEGSPFKVPKNTSPKKEEIK
ncbi:MAG: twin-arginine translocase TatA/TatE family subunit [Candidatus Dadabacteria bacterium]|nr:twin-arginine translocase TatA/TatE family subunit [Candidatus Dadabacteria bacterium]